MAVESPETTNGQSNVRAERAPLDVDQDVAEGEEVEQNVPVTRLALAVSFPLLAAAIMTGGLFIGAAPRIQAAIAGLLGVGLAVAVSRTRRPFLTNIVAVAGVFSIGLLLVFPTGFDNVFNIVTQVSNASKSGNILRPPVEYAPGWHAILGWILGGLGFAAAWTAIVLRRTGLAFLIPMVLVGIGAISVPENQQLPSGLVALILSGLGFAILSSVPAESEQKAPLDFHLRRAVRGVPLIAGVTVVIYLVSTADFLFPPPLYDPSQEAKRPRATSVSEAPDRVLFTVKSSISGPWRIGHLDVYEAKDGSWRLPPFAESRLKDVPRSGVLDDELQPGLKAVFEIRGLEGAVLPGLPNLVGIIAKGYRLAYDPRTGSIRFAEGHVVPGVNYTVTAARVPSVEDLRKETGPLTQSIERFLRIPQPPPAVSKLLNEAPTTSAWDRMDYVRQKLLGSVVASGSGVPVNVTPARVEDMLVGSRKATPFEIIAAEAMIARWAGVPSRIGYGFDGGEKTGEDTYEVRPKHGATFLEVYFPSFKWLPVISTPHTAKPQLTSNQQIIDLTILPSQDVAIELFFPTVQPPESILLEEARQILLIFVPIVLILLLLYYTYPALVKGVARRRRRATARAEGPNARVALAYAEWRDYATDLGYLHLTDTPLMFLDRVADDHEHRALAWLVTRGLWGDLQNDLRDQDAEVAERLSASIRRRAARAHPWTLRSIAAVSRLSLRNQFAPELAALPTVSKRGRRVPKAA